MGLILAATAGLVLLIVLWAIGAEGLDASMATLLIILCGVAARIVASHRSGQE